MNELKDLRDREIICVDCGKAFTWNREEQAFYLSKGLQPPKRCKDCRLRRKLTIATKAVTND
jgi:hypothetical protein